MIRPEMEVNKKAGFQNDENRLHAETVNKPTSHPQDSRNNILA
jgi:hypothetical protein